MHEFVWCCCCLSIWPIKWLKLPGNMREKKYSLIFCQCMSSSKHCTTESFQSFYSQKIVLLQSDFIHHIQYTNTAWWCVMYSSIYIYVYLNLIAFCSVTTSFILLWNIFTDCKQLRHTQFESVFSLQVNYPSFRS